MHLVCTYYYKKWLKQKKKNIIKLFSQIKL